MKWYPILDGRWNRHARKARDLELVVSPTRQANVFKVPSSRRVCDYEVIVDGDRIACLCASETRCKHAGLVVEHLMGWDLKYDLNQYQYLVRMEMVRLLERFYKGEMTFADREEMKRCLKVGEEVLARLNVVVPELEPALVCPF